MGEVGIFDTLVVRPIRRDEVKLWSYCMRQHHYLGYRGIAGRSLRYVAILDSLWVALLGWGSAALKCTARDRFIGWNPETKLKRLYLIANNVRFLVLPGVSIKNLAVFVKIVVASFESIMRFSVGRPRLLLPVSTDLA